MEPPLGSLAPWNRSPWPPPPAPLFTAPSRRPRDSQGGDGNVRWVVIAVVDGHSDLAGDGARPLVGVLALVVPGWRRKRLGTGCGRRRLTPRVGAPIGVDLVQGDVCAQGRALGHLHGDLGTGEARSCQPPPPRAPAGTAPARS